MRMHRTALVLVATLTAAVTVTVTAACGSAGPQGPAGAEGTPGPTGSPGAPGLNGAHFAWEDSTNVAVPGSISMAPGVMAVATNGVIATIDAWGTPAMVAGSSGGLLFAAANCTGSPYLATSSVPPPRMAYRYADDPVFRALPVVVATTNITVASEEVVVLGVQQCQNQNQTFGALVVLRDTVAGAAPVATPDLSSFHPPFHPVATGF